MNLVKKPQKKELVNILIDAIESFPPYDGTLSLSLSSGDLASFMRSTSGNSEAGEGKKIKNRYQKYEKMEVIRRLETSIEQIGAWGKLVLTFKAGVLEDICWNSTFNLMMLRRN